MRGRVSRQCERQVKAVAKYIKEDSIKQANIFIDTFNETAAKICKHPTMGMPYKKGMRKIVLGKFLYNLFYKIEKERIYFIGIHSMRRGTEFEYVTISH